MTGGLRSKYTSGDATEAVLTDDNIMLICDRGFESAARGLSVAIPAKLSYSQFANVRSHCQQIVLCDRGLMAAVIVHSRNSGATLMALVDSLQHDPFYVAITSNSLMTKVVGVKRLRATSTTR